MFLKQTVPGVGLLWSLIFIYS